MSHADTLRDLLSLLTRTRRLLDELVNEPDGLTSGRLARCEAMAGRITDRTGHPTTGAGPADDVLTLLAHLDAEGARATEPTETAPRPMACDGCGDRLPTRYACISPSGRHTPRPLPELRESAARTEETVPPGETAPPPHDYSMPHRLGLAFASLAELAAAEEGVELCPPNCPRRRAAEERARPLPEPESWGDPVVDERARQLAATERAEAPARESSEPAARTGETVPPGGPGCDLKMVHHLGPYMIPLARKPGSPFDDNGHPPNCPAYRDPARTESREPAAPVETPEARAKRLDVERDAAGSAYRRATQAADAAWRAIGGRP